MDKLNPRGVMGIGLTAPPMRTLIKPKGVFHLEIRDPSGRLVRKEDCPNTVAIVGMNLMLSTFFAGAAYTVTGPFMGLISSASFSGVLASDTLTSHPGWLEAGTSNAPTYTAPRPTLSFSAPSGGTITTSAPASYSITGNGTIKGAFIALGTGAVSTILNSGGTLWCATLFSGGDAVVTGGFTLSINYTVTI